MMDCNTCNGCVKAEKCQFKFGVSISKTRINFDGPNITPKTLFDNTETREGLQFGIYVHKS